MPRTKRSTREEDTAGDGGEDEVRKELQALRREIAEIKGLLLLRGFVATAAAQHRLQTKDAATQTKGDAPEEVLSEERSCAEALMMACDERLGAQSPAALMVCDTFLARDFWTSFVHQSYLPPAASELWMRGSNGNGQFGTSSNGGHGAELQTEVTALHGRRIHAAICGGGFTIVLVGDGELWAAGHNFSMQLGLVERKNFLVFTRVSAAALAEQKVAAVACGGNHTLAVLETGELFAWGRNIHGELGLGHESDSSATPEPVAALRGRRVVAIACSSWHSVAVLETGELFAWGRNEDGQLGLGDDDADRNEPTQVTALAGRRVVAVACGRGHTAAVSDSGKLFTWGWNGYGELGHGDLTDSENTPQLVEALRGRPVIAVACGDYHTVALLESGEVFAWGNNDQRQLGLGESSGEFNDNASTPQHVPFFDGKQQVKSVHCGGNSSAVVMESGEVVVWGNNVFGLEGVESIRSIATPTLVPLEKRAVFVACSDSHSAFLCM